MNDNFLISRMRDIYTLCNKYHTPRFSGFLDEREQAEVMEEFPDAVFFGGCSGAERRMLGAFPDWQEPDNVLFPIKVLIFTKRSDKTLTHRHYLGTILSLGIERAKVGDILIDGDKAYVFLSADIAEYIKNEIHKIAGAGVTSEIKDCAGVPVPEKKFENIDAVCASLRLDAVLAGVLNKSRSEVKKIILSGKIAVNHLDTVNPDCMLKENDLLSIRGFGRVRVSVIGGMTRSGRLHITLKKYI